MDMCIPMGNHSDRVKLASLRARTDRQLVAIIHRELERGLDSVLQYAETYAENNRDGAEQVRANAERACASAVKLLPVVYTLGEPERREIEAKLRGLREALDRLPASGEIRARTAGA